MERQNFWRIRKSQTQSCSLCFSLFVNRNVILHQLIAALSATRAKNMKHYYMGIIKRNPYPRIEIKKFLFDGGNRVLSAIVNRDRTIEYIEPDPNPELVKEANRQARRDNFEIPFDDIGHFNLGKNLFFYN